jgi:hypothetical protein
LISVAVVTLGATVALAMGLLSIPPGPVVATHGPWLGGSNSTLDVTLGGVPPGYDVGNRTYAGWCIEDNHRADVPDGSLVMLLDSTDPPVLCSPGDYPGIDWALINYLLNHQQGTINEVQAAMWEVAGTNDPSSPSLPLTPTANDMVTDTLLNGPGFMPGPGDVVAVILCGDGLGPDGFQDTIIEVPIPRYSSCTPGYWKQRHHFDSWPPRIDPRQFTFRDAFGVGPRILLARALRLGGGGERALLRHASAAFLNAASDGVGYPYTVDEVRNLVRRAYRTGEFEAVKNILEAANEDYPCPLN